MTITILPVSPPKNSRKAPSSALVALLVLAVVAAGAAGWWLTRGSGQRTTALNTPVVKRVVQTQPRSAQEWLSAALTAAKQAGSVHLELVARAQGRTSTFSDDDGPTSGIQRISVSPDMQAQVRVIGSKTFFIGNRAALLHYFQLPKSLATKAAYHWVQLQPGDPDYESVTQGVTLSSALTQIVVRPPLKLIRGRVIDGMAVVGLRGNAGHGATATLWVTVGGSHLPVGYNAADTKHASMTVRFSAWGASDHGPSYPVDVNGVVTKTSDCVETPASSASAEAVAYVSAVQAGVPAWVAVDNSLRSEFGEVHRLDLLTEARADAAFLSRLKRIPFPEDAARYATDLENALRGYVDLLNSAAAHNGYLTDHEAERSSLLNARVRSSGQLRSALGLEPSGCTFLRP